MSSSYATTPTTHKTESMARHAGTATALRGVLAVLFGVIAIRNPQAAASAFVIVFAVYAFADGVLNFVLAERFGRAGQRWGWYLFAGIATIALGVVALVYPGLTFVTLVFIVGLRAIALGIFDVIAAFAGEEIESRWLLGITGVLSVVLGILLMATPVTGGAALIWAIGVYAIVLGIGHFAHGLRMLSSAKHEKHEEMLPRPPAAAAT
jgi:uncharacterized membrane protein HdeD (DUF308 family)